MAQSVTDIGTRSRSKPLRTYGKRSAATTDPDHRGPAAVKRQRIDARDTSEPRSGSDSLHRDWSPVSDASNMTRESDTIVVAVSPEPDTSVKKGSILNFFRPISEMSSPTSSSTSKNSPPPAPSSPPPMSPPSPLLRAQIKRRPRILRIRGNSYAQIGVGVRKSSSEDDRRLQKGLGGQCKEEDCTRVTQDQADATQTETGASTKTKSKPKPAQRVQTTLNLSSRAAFSECKICNTVWNPLYPDDVKYHTKQHATVLRAQKKIKELEL